MRLSIRCITRVSLLAILCCSAQMSFAQSQIDLTIQAFSLSGSSTLSPGERIGSRLSATAHNAGSAPSGTFAVGFYLSQDSVITTEDTLLTGGREFESSLDNSGSRSIGIASVMSIPDDTAAGSYFLGVIVDELNTNEENDETNNTAAFVVTVVKNLPDLTVTSFSLSGSSTLAAGETVGPRLSATVENIGIADASQFAVGFYLSTDATITTADTLLVGGREFESGLAVNGSLSVGIASVMQIPAEMESGAYYLGVIVDELGANEENDETNNTAAFAVTIVKDLPDLTVTSFSLSGSSTLAAGETVGPNLSATVENIGIADASQFAVGFYLSTDATITTGDTLLVGGREFESGLAANSSLSVGIASVMQIPSDTESGTYFLGVIVDELGANEENDETNNTAAFAVTIVKNLPDLTVTSFSLSGSSTLAAGETVGPNLSATVDNVGVADAGQFAVGFYLSTDATITTADTLLVGGREFESGLDANGSLSVGIASVMRIPSETEPGTYYLGVIVDELDANEENDETNNTAAFVVTVVGAGPDLQVTQFSLSGQNTVAAGETVGPNLSATVLNAGSTGSGQFALGFYLSTDATITTADRLLVGGREFEDGLEAGNSLSAGIASVMQIPADIEPGVYFLGVIVDELGAIEEADETNNTATILVNVQSNLPDLTVTSFTLAGENTIAGEQTIGPNLSASVRNSGVADAGQFALGFYLSTDTIITTDDILLIGGREFEDGLEAGGSLDVGIASVMQIPSGIEPGIYFLGVIVDELGAIEEADETNNTATVLVNVQSDLPDLTVTSFTLAGENTIAGEQTIGPNLSATVRNAGFADVGQFALGFYLSTDPIITTDDILLIGGREFEDGLEAGGSLDVGIASVMQIPNGIEPGVYFLGVIVDELGAIEEANETNNTATIIVSVQSNLPDLLIMSYYLSDSTLVAGEAMGSRLFVTAYNAGHAASDQFALGFYLSNDPIITTDDTLLIGGREFEDGLEPNASVDVGIASVMSVPADTEPGTYFLGVIVDELGAIEETDETNNTEIVMVTVVADMPDLVVTSFDLTGEHILAAGQTIGPNLSATVSNQGSVSADQFALGFYLSNDPIITTDDTLLIGGREFEDGLEAGGSLNVGIASVMQIPDGTAPGTYFLGVIVDELSVIDEADESNNTASVIVSIDQSLPDLTVAEFGLANGNAVAAGQAIGPRLSLSVRNDGFASSEQFAIGFYLSTDPIITTTDTLLLGGREFEDGLAVDASVDVGIASVMSIPEGTEPGVYFLGVIVDELLANAETDESNNTASQLVTVTEALPDLTVTDFTIANGGVLPIGQPIGSRLSVTAENIGVVASGQFAIGFYLSNDPIITTDDTLLTGGREFEDGLETNASLSVGIASVMSVPEGTEPGVYFLGVIVDELGAIEEMDEANNTSVRTVTVGDSLPDLTVYGLSLADGNELPIGQAIGPRLSLIVQNIGGAASEQIAIGFYLSTDDEITTDDVLLLGGREFESSIDQGGLRDVGIASVMSLPEGTETGNYFLGVIVDELEANTELDETNNTFVLPVVVTPEETGIEDWLMH